MSMQRRVGAAKGAALRAAGAAAAWALRQRPVRTYRPGITVITVNWNSLPFLRSMLDATRAMSPPGTEILVVDNGSTDGSVEYLGQRGDVRVVRLPVNVGHGVALDVGAALVDTEHLAVLDIDAFPVSDRWLEESLAALDAGAQVAGAHLHRNFVHPCFLVTTTRLLRAHDLTFRPVGSLARLDSQAPLFLDVGEALSQRVIVKFGGSRALHFIEVTSLRGPSMAGAVFGGLVYHNMFATQGSGRDGAVAYWNEALAEHHPDLAVHP
jgi:glycosyltransferase involved in cell wall biosynthesis